ncbi:MAG: hypothetical protein OXC80_05465 [Gammaproteobacteria bacterium]|nr:hypothetical protein [Gammaproteobacteria bacterium]
MKEIPRFDYEGTLKKLKNRESVSEQDVNTEIINSVLEDVLGYSHIQRESQDKGQRPDFLCFRDDNSLDLIVEGKPLDTDLDKRPSRSDAATRIPKVQLEEYVKKYRFSDDGVFGLLSNGEEWRVCQRRELDVVWLTSKKADTYEDLKHALNPLIHRGSSRILRKFSNKDGFNLLDKIRHSVAHDDLLMQMAEPEATLEPHTNWLSSIEIVSKSNSDGISPNSYLVSIKSRADDGIIAVQDIHDALKETYLYDESIEVAGLAVEIDQEDGRCSVCRIFAWDGGKLVTSAPFDPELPGTLVLEHLEMLTRYANQGISDLVNSLNANPIRSKFYDDLAEWFKRTGTELDDLRHLVRILFTWFLKEKGVIPSEVFEKNSGISVHDQLVHLFTRILPVEENLRRHPIEYDVLEQAYADSPFLNGSLFSEEDGLLRSPLRDIDYLGGEGTNRPGLFTILKRYEWTLTEHTQVHSDIALDPSMIGSVFERFLAIATEVDIGPLARQPDGAYYTPKDLTEEMVCDALAHSSVEQVQGVEFDDMLNIIRYDGGAVLMV